MRSFTILSVFLICFSSLVTKGQESQMKCANQGEYCQNHWECCSNSCLSYSLKCVRSLGQGQAENNSLETGERFGAVENSGQQPQINDLSPGLSGPPTVTQTSLLEFLDTIWAPTPRPWDPFAVPVSEQGILPPPSNANSIPTPSAAQSSIASTSTPSDLNQRFGGSEDTGNLNATTETTVAVSSTVTGADASQCKQIGEKCFTHEECCTVRCHGFLHQCVT